MSMVEAIGSATSSLSAAMDDLAASAHNIANLRTAKPTSGPAFQGERVVRTEAPEGGVETSVVPEGTEEGIVMLEPEHPEADVSGAVRYPSIDVGAELVKIQMAQRTVEANVATIEAAIDTYRELLSISSTERERLTAVSA